MKNKFLFIGLAALFCSCNETPVDEPIVPPVDQEKIPISLSTDISTKVTDDSYEAGDQIGVYIVNYNNGMPEQLAASGNHLDNTMYTYDGNTWETNREVYWKDATTPADFYCYYPYVSSVTNVNDLKISVQTDQSDMTAYKSSDFLWGKAENHKPSSKPVSITTRHKMSNILISLRPGKGYTEDELSAENISVVITGIQTDASLNLATGAVTAEGNQNDIIPMKDNGSWKALVVPQDINNRDLINVTVGETLYTLKQTVSFQSGKQHLCTLTVNKISEGINIGIEGWETDDTDFGGTLE